MDQVNEYIAQGSFSATDSAWHDGLAGWVPLNQIAGVVVASSPSPPLFDPNEFEATTKAWSPTRAPAEPTPAEPAPAATVDDPSVKPEVSTGATMARITFGILHMLVGFTVMAYAAFVSHGKLESTWGTWMHIIVDGVLLFIIGIGMFVAGIALLAGRWSKLVDDIVENIGGFLGMNFLWTAVVCIWFWISDDEMTKAGTSIATSHFIYCVMVAAYLGFFMWVDERL